MNPPWALAQDAIELALRLMRKNPATKVTLLLPSYERKGWYVRYMADRPRRRAFKVETKPAQAKGDDPYLIDFFGGDNWGGLGDSAGARWGAGDGLRATGPCPFPLIVASIGPYLDSRSALR